jgi:hypothetical protein
LKKPAAGVFLSNFGLRALTLRRTIERIKTIQKEKPNFNYDENWILKHNVDSMISTLEEIKKIKPNE